MHPQQPERELTDEQLLLILLGVAAVAFGVIPLASIFEPVKAWILDHHILVTGRDMVVEVFNTGMGFDTLRLVILGAAVVLTLATVGGYIHHRHIRSAQE